MSRLILNNTKNDLQKMLLIEKTIFQYLMETTKTCQVGLNGKLTEVEFGVFHVQ